MPDDITRQPTLQDAILDAATRSAEHRIRYIQSKDTEALKAFRWWNRHLNNLLQQQERASDPMEVAA